jgi:hypothetical protein
MIYGWPHGWGEGKFITITKLECQDIYDAKTDADRHIYASFYIAPFLKCDIAWYGWHTHVSIRCPDIIITSIMDGYKYSVPPLLLDYVNIYYDNDQQYAGLSISEFLQVTAICPLRFKRLQLDPKYAK